MFKPSYKLDSSSGQRPEKLEVSKEPTGAEEGNRPKFCVGAECPGLRVVILAYLVFVGICLYRREMVIGWKGYLPK